MEIRKGDRVRITTSMYDVVGTVVSATNYKKYWLANAEDNWYIEFIADEGGFGYWKQGNDGGTIEVLR